MRAVEEYVIDGGFAADVYRLRWGGPGARLVWARISRGWSSGDCVHILCFLSRRAVDI